MMSPGSGFLQLVSQIDAKYIELQTDSLLLRGCKVVAAT